MSVLRGIAEELPGLGVMVDGLEADPCSEYRAALCYGFIIALFAAKIITHEVNTAAMLEIEKIQDSVYEGVQS